jgi:steroid delta-isomerase-like uncharacterized protein
MWGCGDSYTKEVTMAQQPNTQQNMKVVRKLYECYNTNDPKKMSSCEELMSPNVRFHDPATPAATSGTQAVKMAENSYMMAFPNKSTTIDEIIASEDDQVVVRWHTTGTQKGQFLGMQPSNRNFNVSGISIYHFSNGKIDEIWQNWDSLGLIEQLGEKTPRSSTPSR